MTTTEQQIAAQQRAFAAYALDSAQRAVAATKIDLTRAIGAAQAAEDRLKILTDISLPPDTETY